MFVLASTNLPCLLRALLDLYLPTPMVRAGFKNHLLGETISVMIYVSSNVLCLYTHLLQSSVMDFSIYLLINFPVLDGKCSKNWNSYLFIQNLYNLYLCLAHGEYSINVCWLEKNKKLLHVWNYCSSPGSSLSILAVWCLNNVFDT